MRKITINQPAGVGDIMFLEPLLRMLSRDHEIEMPVVDQYAWIADHIPYVNFTPYRCQFDSYVQKFTSTYYPFRFSNPIHRGYSLHDWHDMENCMLDKYRVIGLPDTMWMDLQLVRNRFREKSLFEHLGSPTDFILVNEQSRVGECAIKLETDLPVIYMEAIDGYSVVDWCIMMERARENHHVSTSTFYLLHMLGVDAVIYPRPDVDGLKGISQLLPMTKMRAAPTP